MKKNYNSKEMPLHATQHNEEEKSAGSKAKVKWPNSALLVFDTD